DRLVRRVVRHPRHAHQLRLAVNLRGARAALPRLAVPAHGQVGGLLGLDGVDGVEHDHPFSRRNLVVVKPTAITRSSKYAEQGHTLSLMSAMRSAGIGGCTSRRTAMRPPSFLITICSRACFSSGSGWSLRVWPPRLSVRSSAARAVASATMSRDCRSMAVCQPGLYSRLPVTPTFRARPLSVSRSESAFSRQVMSGMISVERCLFLL